MANFSKYKKATISQKQTVPSKIYESLDRKSEAGPLRPTQDRILTEWYSNRRQDRDIIIKLPTGAGKTLIGLLIGLSYLNSNSGPVVYVCPNIYLMQQACADAEKFGIPFCHLGTNEREIPQEFLNSQKILITYVQKIFNGLSLFGIGGRSFHVGCIILDDSHACMDSILSSCTIRIEKKDSLYNTLLSLFVDDLKQQGEGTYQDILNGHDSDSHAIPYWAWHDKGEAVIQLLSTRTQDSSIKFAWPLIRDQIPLCRAYVSSNAIEISPECIPIKSFGIFHTASHRVLMSATTQEDTLFVKGLDLSISAIENPLIDSNYRWSGEKMILIPSMICKNTKQKEIENLLLTSSHEKYGLAVLVPSFEKASKYTSYGAILANKGTPNMYSTVIDFVRASPDIVSSHRRNIVFANRYDGIDLPDESCRILIIDSLPYADNLADNYEELCRSNSDIAKIKIAQKIEQGLGRSVRGEKDYSVIILLGDDLIKFIRSSTNKNFFSPQTQKQLDIGFEIANMDSDNSSDELSSLMETINQCIDRDSDWKDYYNEKMDEICESSENRSSIYTVLLEERLAYDCAVSGNYEDACLHIQKIVDIPTIGEDKYWYMQLLAKYQHFFHKSTSAELQHTAFSKNNELLKPTEVLPYKKLSTTFSEKRANSIINYVSKFPNFIDFQLSLRDILSQLSFSQPANKFEHAVEEIGKLLGFQSQRPDKSFRQGPDNLWCDDHQNYMLIECKSNVSSDRTGIHKSEAGQMDQHCGWFETEYPGHQYTSYLIIPTTHLDDDAYLTHNTKIISKSQLSLLKSNIEAFSLEFKDYDIAGLTPETVSSWLISHKLHSNFLEEYYSVSPN